MSEAELQRCVYTGLLAQHTSSIVCFSFILPYVSCFVCWSVCVFVCSFHPQNIPAVCSCVAEDGALYFGIHGRDVLSPIESSTYYKTVINIRTQNQYCRRCISITVLCSILFTMLHSLLDPHSKNFSIQGKFLNNASSRQRIRCDDKHYSNNKQVHCDMVIQKRSQT